MSLRLFGPAFLAGCLTPMASNSKAQRRGVSRARWVMGGIDRGYPNGVKQLVGQFCVTPAA